MKIRLSLLACAFIYSQASYAIYFCPRDNTIIESDATIQEVTQLCGKPDSTTTNKVKAEGPQEWKYYMDQSGAPAGTAKMQMIVAFKDNKAISITVNGAGVSESELCGKLIQINNSMDQIKASCGEALFKSTPEQANVPGAKEKEITQFFYRTTPPVTLIFIDGKLVERK